jgi:hypothetical protein
VLFTGPQQLPQVLPQGLSISPYEPIHNSSQVISYLKILFLIILKNLLCNKKAKAAWVARFDWPPWESKDEYDDKPANEPTDDPADEHDELADEHDELADEYCSSYKQRRPKALFDSRFTCRICRDKKRKSAKRNGAKEK